MQKTTMLAFLAGVAATGGVVVLTGFGPEHEGHGQDTGHGAGNGQQASMTPEEEMAAWMATANPGEQHAALARSVGSWKAKTSFLMDPTAPPVEAEGTMTCEWVLGGRFVKADFHVDDMMGMPFDGLSYVGYDNIKQEYVSTWMDTFGTGIMMMTGTHDGDTATMGGTFMSPMGEETMKIVTEWTDDDHFTDTFYDLMPDGSWQKSGHIEYSRK